MGLHAGDVLRAARSVRAALPNAIIVATVATNDTAAAVLAAGLGAGTGTEAGLGDIALVESFASWGGLARAPRYDQGAYYAWVRGVLQHFDLPDLVAAAELLARPPRVLLVSPLDALRRRLSAAGASSLFAFASASGRVQIALNASAPADVDRLLCQWLDTRA